MFVQACAETEGEDHCGIVDVLCSEVMKYQGRSQIKMLLGSFLFPAEVFIFKK